VKSNGPILAYRARSRSASCVVVPVCANREQAIEHASAPAMVSDPHHPVDPARIVSAPE
jgi:hypothetical protein